MWFTARPVGEAVDRPLRAFLPLPITQNQLILLVRGQQTKTLVKAPGVPVGLIQDLTDKKKNWRGGVMSPWWLEFTLMGGCDSSAVFQVLLLQCLTPPRLLCSLRMAHCIFCCCHGSSCLFETMTGSSVMSPDLTLNPHARPHANTPWFVV